MSERALRGTRLGATSYETDSGIDLAPRQEVEYACPSGHRFSMPFFVEAEVPTAWECRVCGAQATRVGGGTAEDDKPVKPTRTHWDMLLERRSIPELEEVLAERLGVLRGGGIGGALGSRARRSAPVNMATGAPQTVGRGTATSAAEAEPRTDGAEAEAEADPAATTTAGAAKKPAAAKKPVAKKTTAGTAPANKNTASKAAPATRPTDRPVKKPTTKKPTNK